MRLLYSPTPLNDIMRDRLPQEISRDAGRVYRAAVFYNTPREGRKT